MHTTVEARCPNPDCRQAYQAADDKLGKQGRCRKCGTLFTFAVDGASPKRPAGRETQAGSKSTLPGSASADQQVKRLGRFEIRGRLGSGAFGTVYRAYDPQLDREVALKVPHTVRLENPRFVKRFLNEAKLAARLQHPHIVPVFDAGKDGKRYYIASAFIEGGTLDTALDRRAFDFRETARIVMQLAEALAYAHQQQIVHRDVKPDNVMLDENGEPHLMDFGLARLQTSDEKLTQAGDILGTPAYISPEQAQGDKDESDESNDVTAASDQYSLGVTLYEMLCGELPFSGPPEIVIFNVIQTEPPAPRSIKSDVPRDLETICQKAMSKKQ
jgi:serine/threonine protein kinase